MRKKQSYIADQKIVANFRSLIWSCACVFFYSMLIYSCMFCTRPEAAGKRGHCQPFLPTQKTHSCRRADSHAPVSPDARHRDQRLALVTAAWLMTVVTQKNNSGDGAHQGKGHRRACVWFFSAHKLYVSLLPTCVCPRHRGLQKLPSPSSSHDKYEWFENPDQGVTNRITCCLHLVVIIRALMTGEELIEMKITQRRVQCAHGSAWTLNGCLEW